MVSSEELAATLSGAPPKSIGGSAVRGVVWTTLGNLANRLSGLLLFLVLARLLLPAEFGILAAAQVFLALSRVLVDAGLTRTLVQRSRLRAAHLDSALLVTGGLGAVLSIAMLVSAPLIAWLRSTEVLAANWRPLSIARPSSPGSVSSSPTWPTWTASSP